jgi:predicted RecA/RadA family phage recombinase
LLTCPLRTDRSNSMTVLGIRVHPRDNVAVVAADVQPGDVVRLDDGGEVRAIEAIPRGSKVALGPIVCGEAVVRYGEEIGRATKDIAAGEYVHTHNLARER